MAPVSYYFGVDLYKILVIHRLCVHHMVAYSEERGAIANVVYLLLSFLVKIAST